MYRRASHWFGVAVLTKYNVPVCAAPSESNIVSDGRLVVTCSGWSDRTAATGGGVALAGRLMPYSTLVVVACGAESVVCSRRSRQRPVLKPPSPVSGIDLQALLLRVHDEAVAVDAERAGARVRERAAVGHDEEALAADRQVEAASR